MVFILQYIANSFHWVYMSKFSPDFWLGDTYVWTYIDPGCIERFYWPLPFKLTNHRRVRIGVRSPALLIIRQILWKWSRFLISHDWRIWETWFIEMYFMIVKQIILLIIFIPTYKEYIKLVMNTNMMLSN